MNKLASLSTLALLLTLPTGCPAENPDVGQSDDEIGDAEPSDPPDQASCEDVPPPWLPFPAGTSMGITQKPGCGDHLGSLYFGYDFNVLSTYETDHDLIATASSNGTVVHVVDWVTEGCVGCTAATHNGGWGNCVIVQLEDSCVYERYCHLDAGPDSIFVEAGDPVCAGTPLGLIGATGNTNEPHLHWQRENSNHQSIAIESFVEMDVPNGCDACIVYDNQGGCFASENQPECGASPTHPCSDLQDGDYCGSNDDLQDYPGDATDLVTCTAGEVASVTPCEYGCEEMPEGTNDACHAQTQECGNGTIEPGEQCDEDVGDQTCASVGFDEGTLACDPSCSFDTQECCNYQPTVMAAMYPDFTKDGNGCALNNGVRLKASAEPLSDSVIRFHVRKTDDSVWTQPAVLSLYVGAGPTCGDPANVVKTTAPVVVGEITQTLDLVVDPYDAAWPNGQIKEFWVGKSESEYTAARASGSISILRDCL